MVKKKIIKLVVFLFLTNGVLSITRGDIGIVEDYSDDVPVEEDSLEQKDVERVDTKIKDEVQSNVKSRISAVSSPFFFLCRGPRQGEPSNSREDVDVTLITLGKLSLSSGYTPDAIYEIGVTSSKQFDGFLLTGVHALTKEFSVGNHLQIPRQALSKNSLGLVCSVLHSQTSQKPRYSTNLMWQAPKKGTGCVHFLATGSMQNQLLFKDLLLQEVCEKDETSSPLRLPTSHFGTNNEGFIFKDDFDKGTLDNKIWSKIISGSVNTNKHHSGHSMLFNGTNAMIETYPLNFEDGQYLQFGLGPGNCQSLTKVRLSLGTLYSVKESEPLRMPQEVVRAVLISTEDGDLTDSDEYGVTNTEGITGSTYSPVFVNYVNESDDANETDDSYVRQKRESILPQESFVSLGCSDWEEISVYSIRPSMEVHTKNIPEKFRAGGTCVKWEVIETTKVDSEESEECWSLDNVAAVNMEAIKGAISDDFDPVDPSNWLFFPGGQIKEFCGSEGHSLAFDRVSDDSWTITRSVDLNSDAILDDAIMHFNMAEKLEGWEITGGEIGNCLPGDSGLVFNSEGKREVCSDPIDGRNFDVISMKIGACGDGSVELVTSIETEDGHREVVASRKVQERNELWIFPFKAHLHQEKIRVCVYQDDQQIEGELAWMLIKVTLLPWMPKSPVHYFQSHINLNCGYGVASVDIEASNDGGSNWWSVHELCTPGNCDGSEATISKSTASELLKGWALVNVPLPYVALTPTTRIRVRQLASGDSIWRPAWTIDNVFIGKCPEACHGHGLCQENGICKCQYGYDGISCDKLDYKTPIYISEPFSDKIENSANILEVSGGSSSFRCGLVGQGAAAVFQGDGERFVTTVDVNTTDAHFFKFNFMSGTESEVGKCPGPDQDSESILVHYSCSGGATWHLLQTLHARDHKKPSHISLPLTSGSRGNACRFQIWQPENSGSGKDMWAVDDITVTSRQYNTVELNFEDQEEANNNLRFHLGKIGSFCNRSSTMVLSGSSPNANGLYRFIETKSVSIGPSYMMQFEIVIGCNQDPEQQQNSTVVLEYSLNHGLTWKLLHPPCLPSIPGCHSRFSRGKVYHVSEVNPWKRITLYLPKHTWSSSTRLRLRQIEPSTVGLPWAVDNLYIGHQCTGLCSGHGFCTTGGCRCDESFYSDRCMPLHKIPHEIDADFDIGDDVKKYDFKLTGASVVEGTDGCGTIVAGKNVYFSGSGLRQFETDDINAVELRSVRFHLAIGGNQKGCHLGVIKGKKAEDKIGYGSVVLEYSNDGGISWNMLKELTPIEFRRPRPYYQSISTDILNDTMSTSGIMRFRLWQPIHGTDDQWAIDSFLVKQRPGFDTLLADFQPGSLTLDPWLTSTKFSRRNYCNGSGEAQVMDNNEPVRMVVTNPLILNETDVISFQISVGCEEDPNDQNPVRLEYSRDGGSTWELVRKGCLPSSTDCDAPQEPSLYWPGHHGPWTRVEIPVKHDLQKSEVMLRWVQSNPSETKKGEFAIREIYVGPKCKMSCNGHGKCIKDQSCICDDGITGKYCGRLKQPGPLWLRENFETKDMNPEFWERVEGGLLSAGCGTRHHGQVMMFSADGHRAITTNELDTINVKYLVFDLQIGASHKESPCRKGISPRDNVILEYSINNGLDWQLLKEIEPLQTINRTKPFFVPLPPRARTSKTKFRWWQIPPHMLKDDSGPSAEWQLDNIMVLANETLPSSLTEDFEEGMGHIWFSVVGATVTDDCQKDGNSLVFNGQEGLRYAETWDFDATSASIAQFDVTLGCDQRSRNLFSSMHVEVSTDNGRNWKLLRENCDPSAGDCQADGIGNDLPTIYTQKLISNWTRVTIKMNNVAGERARLRFKQKGEIDPSSSWAIDNLYIGNDCPWMCSGHGQCQKGYCSCDDGYFGTFCVPSSVLPCELLDNFDTVKETANISLWLDVQGADVSNRCGTLISKNALVFYKEHPRYATTIDLDMTGGQFVQFTLSTSCTKEAHRGRWRHGNSHYEYQNTDSTDIPEQKSSVLLQYTINGGITWNLMKKVLFSSLNTSGIFISALLEEFPEAQSNSTRFRLWQPVDDSSFSSIYSDGPLSAPWAIDDIYIGGLPSRPNVLYDDFSAGVPARDAWINWPGANIGIMCERSSDPRTALTFGSEEGEHSAYTRDLEVDENTLVQFDIRVGCESITTYLHKLTLEYSQDLGITWDTLRPNMFSVGIGNPQAQTPSEYNANADNGWTRVSIPLSETKICGRVRFRWWQGYYSAKETPEPWALDNVYIGPTCTMHCSGHGYCLSGDQCVCDDGYEGGDSCTNSVQKPTELNQDFEDGILSQNQFVKWSGAQISSECEVISGSSLVFWQQGEKMLVTTDLDLTSASVFQFYIRLGCHDEDWETSSGKSIVDLPILFQFSTDGGIRWEGIHEISWGFEGIQGLENTHYFSLAVPETAKSNSTRLRWWQPSKNGEFQTQWAIDQIHIGHISGSPFFFDDGSGSSWLIKPGSTIEQTCSLPYPGLHFNSNIGVRFSETNDIATSLKAFIQFEIAMHCQEAVNCYDVDVEYSLNYGLTWELVRDECLSSDADCPDAWNPSIFTSDAYAGLNLVTIPVPKRARSKVSRFRIGQKHGWKPQESWVLGRVYVGDECEGACSGRGFCDCGVCDCQEGWNGTDCSERTTPLPEYIADDFVGAPVEGIWAKVIGAKVSQLCGPVASGAALHFYGSCSRLLETISLDLRKSLFVQFDLMTGCLDHHSSTKADDAILVQASCSNGIQWTTLKTIYLIHDTTMYIWIEIPRRFRCLGGKLRWWQAGTYPRTNLNDWAIDTVVVGGKSIAPSNLTLENYKNFTFPLWLRKYNSEPGMYCELDETTQVLESTPSEAAIAQTSDVQLSSNHSLYFNLALGCEALWDNDIEPVSLEYSRDFGRTWQLVRTLCLPFLSATCGDLHDESVFYAPQNWHYYVFPLDHIGPARYIRFRWIQNSTSDVMGSHKWSLRDVYIGQMCPNHCYGRGRCMEGVCLCNDGYEGDHCQIVTKQNAIYIKDSFKTPKFLPHWHHIQGGLLAPGCQGGIEEPPAASFQGPHTRALVSLPLDMRSGRFVLFTAVAGSQYGAGLCRSPEGREQNMFLQYSVDGGIKWHLLRELDHNLYRNPMEDYILLPRHAMTAATVFRFWQPHLPTIPPAWVLDDVFIGGSEIGPAEIKNTFDNDKTISEWLFAPHSHSEMNYCERGDNASLVWYADEAGRRSITTQELIVTDGHILQFKISVGCNEVTSECSRGPSVHLEFTKDGGVHWNLIRENCLPETSADPDCIPYVFHGPTIFDQNGYAKWTRVMIMMPEKTWSSTTQLRWIQDSRGDTSMVRVLSWALDDVIVGVSCPNHCSGRGECIEGRCKCDYGYEGPGCNPHPSLKQPLPTSLVDGFEGGTVVNWAEVSGGSIGSGCGSMAPNGHGKQLYFSGCGLRHAVTQDLDTRRASKVMFVLKIGSTEGPRSCRIDLSDESRAADKSVVLQISSDNGVTWNTINVHDPRDFAKARRVAYSLPHYGQVNGAKLRWWQPFHDGPQTDQWSIDNVEIVMAQRKSTNKFNSAVYHEEDL